MCTSIVVNKRKTIVGWNLDLVDMEHRVRVEDSGVYIEVNDPKEGWMPLFGANSRGDFVGMPTCWPHDVRSDPKAEGESIILLDMDLLLQKKTLDEVRAIAQSRPVFSVPGLTFMGALSDSSGNVLHIVPGQGCLYYERPEYKVLTNFSPFTGGSEQHPWMGMDRFATAEELVKNASEDFGVDDCFKVLRAASQEVCPTVVSMVFDVEEREVFWCLDRQWDRVEKAVLKKDAQKNAAPEYSFITLRARPELMERGAEWFSSKWRVPKQAYVDCMTEYLSGRTEYGWYLCLNGDAIVGGLGVIENDFHDRPDLAPNVCAVYTEPEHRGRGIAGRLLNMAAEDMRSKGITPLYLVTDHVGFYERYGWEFFCFVNCFGEDSPSRLYIRR